MQFSNKNFFHFLMWWWKFIRIRSLGKRIRHKTQTQAQHTHTHTWMAKANINFSRLVFWLHCLQMCNHNLYSFGHNAVRSSCHHISIILTILCPFSTVVSMFVAMFMVKVKHKESNYSRTDDRCENRDRYQLFAHSIQTNFTFMSILRVFVSIFRKFNVLNG